MSRRNILSLIATGLSAILPDTIGGQSYDVEYADITVRSGDDVRAPIEEWAATRNHVSVHPLDSTYYLLTEEEFDHLVETEATNTMPRRVELFDCENYAMQFYASVATTEFNDGDYTNQVGVVIDWSGGHAYNIVAFPDGSFRFFEPQNDQYITLGSHDLYDLDRGLILI